MMDSYSSSRTRRRREQRRHTLRCLQVTMQCGKERMMASSLMNRDNAILCVQTADMFFYEGCPHKEVRRLSMSVPPPPECSDGQAVFILHSKPVESTEVRFPTEGAQWNTDAADFMPATPVSPLQDFYSPPVVPQLCGGPHREPVVLKLCDLVQSPMRCSHCGEQCTLEHAVAGRCWHCTNPSQAELQIEEVLNALLPDVGKNPMQSLKRKSDHVLERESAVGSVGRPRAIQANIAQAAGGPFRPILHTPLAGHSGPERCQPAHNKGRRKKDRQRRRGKRRKEQALVESAKEAFDETELRMWGCREGTSKNLRRGTPRPSPSPSKDGTGSDSAASSDTDNSSVSSWQDMCEVCSLEEKRKGPPSQRMCPGCCGRVEVIYERQASKGTTFESFCDEWCDADAASRQKLVRHGLGMWQDLCTSCQLYEGRANAPAPGVCIVCSNKMHGHYHRLKVQVVPFNQMCQIWSRAEANIRYKLLIRQGKTRS